MTNQENAINWFEISVNDLERAKIFYEKIFDFDSMEVQEMMGMFMAFFPSEMGNGKVSGALVKSMNHIPGMTGSMLYLNGNPDLQIVLDRVENAGGKILMPKTKIDENTGSMAFFEDTEGNRIGLHSRG